MDGQGRVFDNILTERFFRSIKFEDIYINSYESMSEVKRGVRDFINYYNNKRLHQSLEHNSPHEVYYQLKDLVVKKKQRPGNKKTKKWS